MTPDSLSLALEAVVTRFANLVRSVGRRHGLADADVDEVMQEVRIRLWRAHGAHEQISDVSTSYVYRTAVSAALDLIRRRRAYRASDTIPITEELDVAASAAGPEEELNASETTAEVARALDTIAEARRPAVRMHLAGYSREEIAQLMGWSEARTRNLLYRGLGDLRERLRERGVEWQVR